MVEVYRVGVTLRLVDEATPALRRLIGALGVANEAVEKLRATLTDLAGTRMAGLSRSMLGVEKRLTGIADAGEQMGATVGASFDRLGIGVGALRTELAGVAAEMKGIAAESRTIRAFSAGGGGGGRGGAHVGGGLHGRVPVGPMHAGFGVSVGAAAGLLAGFGMYEGIKSAASEQLAEFYTVLASGMDPTSPTGRAFAAKVRATAEQTSLGTIFSRLDVAKMMPGIAGMADVPLAQALPFMPGAIRFGEIERQFGTAIGHNFEFGEFAAAAIRMGHLLGVTDPKQMLPILNMLVPATTTSEKSPAQLVNVLQYMMGSAAGVGLSNEEALNLGTLGSILMPGTRAGTSINMMLTGLIPKAGPGAGTRIAQSVKKRNEALRHLNLLDPATGQLYRDAQGGMLLPLIQHLQAYQTANPKEAYGEYVALFQQRGARIAYELGRNPKMVGMATELENREAAFRNMGGVPAVQVKQNETLANQALRSWSDLKTILMDLGETTVPALTVGFKALNTGLEGIRSFLGAHQDIATALGFGGLGLGTLAGAKVLLTLAGAIGRLGASPFALAAGGLSSVTAAIAGLAAVAGAFKLAYDWLKADEKGSPAAGRAVHPSVAAAAAAAAVLGAPQYSGGVGRGVHVLVPGGAVRPPGMQQHGAASSGVFGDLGGAVLGELKTMSAHLAEAKNVTLTGVTNLTGEVRLSVEGFADMIGRMVAKGIQHAVTGLSSSGARPSQQSFVGPT